MKNSCSLFAIVLLVINFCFIGCNNTQNENNSTEELSSESIEQLFDDMYLLNLSKDSNFTVNIYTSLVKRTDDDILIPVIRFFNSEFVRHMYVSGKQSEKGAAPFYNESDAVDRFGYTVSIFRFNRINRTYQMEQVLGYEKDGKQIDDIVFSEHELKMEPVPDRGDFYKIWELLHTKMKIKVGTEIMEMYTDEILPALKTRDYEVLESRIVPY